MAVNRVLLRDVVRRRNTSIRQQEILKVGKPRKRYYAREVGRTCTCSFTITEELDRIIDKRSVEMNISRSAVVRQALMLADAYWSKR